MKAHFRQIIHRVDVAVVAHYTVLGQHLAQAAHNETQRIRALVDVRVAQMRDNETVEAFAELIARYFPDQQGPAASKQQATV